MLTHGTLITWSGYISPIPSNYLSITPAGIQSDLSNSFSNVVVTVDPTAPNGTMTMHVTARTVGDYNSLDDAASAITEVVFQHGTNLDRHSVQCSISSLPNLLSDPTLYALGGGMSPIAPVVSPITNVDWVNRPDDIAPPPPPDGTPIILQPPNGAIPFDSAPPIFQPPQAVSPGRILPVIPSYATDGALPTKKTATRQSDVAPVVTPIDTFTQPVMQGYSINWSGYVSPIASNYLSSTINAIRSALSVSLGSPAISVNATDPTLGVQTIHVSATLNGYSPSDASSLIAAAVRANCNLDSHSIQFSTNGAPSGVVPPFLVIPPSDIVPPIMQVDPNAYLPPSVVTPTQTTAPVSNPVAPVVTPVTTTTQTTAPDPVAPVVNSTATPAAATTDAGATDWTWLLWLAGGGAALYALSGSSHKAR